MTDSQHGRMTLLHHPLRHASHQDVRQSGAPMSAEHYQVRIFGLCRMENFKKRRSDFEEAPALETVVAQALHDLVQLALRNNALFFRDPAHRAEVHRRSQVRARHYRGQRLIDVKNHQFGAKLMRQVLRVAQRQRRIFRKISRSDDFAYIRHDANDTLSPGDWQARLHSRPGLARRFKIREIE